MRTPLELTSIGSPALWIGFISFVVVMLALDLGVFHKKAHVVTVKEALGWSAVWVGCGSSGAVALSIT